jgi:hypothetical protein
LDDFAVSKTKRGWAAMMVVTLFSFHAAEAGVALDGRSISPLGPSQRP